MKKAIALILATLVCGSMLGGCSSSSSSTAASNSNTASKAAGTTNSNAIVIQVGYENNPSEPIHKAMLKWQQLVKEKSKGSMELQLFPSGQLGGKNDLIDQMAAGSAVMTLADGAFYADRGVKDFGIVFAPYLFDTWDQCWKLTKSSWYKDQCDKLEKQGLKIVSSDWEYGDRDTLTKKLVKTPQDLKGMKIRVPNNKIQINTFKALGATSTPMNLNDVYTALQQGTIDGLENPVSVLYNGKYFEVAKYLLLDSHVKNFTTWVCGTSFFNSLTKEQQDILVSTGDEAGLYNNKLTETSTDELIKKMEQAGVTVTTPTDEEKNAFKQAAQPFYEQYKSEWSANLYETVKAAMK